LSAGEVFLSISKESFEEHVDKYIESHFWRRFEDFEGYREYRIREEHYQNHRIRMLANSVSVQNKWVLDVGCGLGGFSVALSKEKARVVGIDPDVACIKISRLRMKRNSISDGILFVACGENIPIRDNTFDIVTCLNVLEHSKAPERVVTEMLRVLKNRGVIFAIIPNRWWPYEPHFRLMGLTYLPRFLALLYIKLVRSKVTDLKYQDLHFFSFNDARKLFHGMKTTSLMNYIVLNPETLQGMYYNRSLLVFLLLLKKLHLSWLLLRLLRLLPLYPNLVFIAQKEKA